METNKPKRWEESHWDLSDEASIHLRGDGFVTLEAIAQMEHGDAPDLAMLQLTNSEAYALLEHLARFFNLLLHVKQRTN